MPYAWFDGHSKIIMKKAVKKTAVFMARLEGIEPPA